MFKIKVGRQEYKITKEDKFMDNGACIQLITQKGCFKNWYYNPIILPKHEVNRLNKLKKIEHPHKYGDGVSIFSIEI